MRNLILIIVLSIFSLKMYSQSGCSTKSNDKMVEYFIAAINAGDTAKIDLYLSSGINLNKGYCVEGRYYEDRFGYNVPFLFVAIQSKKYYVIDYLIRKGADVNLPYKVPIVVQTNPRSSLVPEHGISGYEIYYPLNECLNKNKLDGYIDLKIIKLLLDNGANPNNAVADAQATNNLAIMNLFAEKGVQFNYNSKDLLSAIEKNNSQAFDFYIKSGVKADCACFIAATKKGDIKKLNLFLNQGCSINCFNVFRWNPNGPRQEGVDPFHQLSALGWAVYNGDLNMVKFLIENGADLNARCIWHYGILDPQGKNQSLSEFSDATYRDGKKNKVVTEYLLLAPAIQKKAIEEKQNNIQKYRVEAESFINQGKLDDAKASYNKAYELSRAKKDQDGVVMYFRNKGSNSFNKTHNYDSAAYFYNEAYKLSKADIDKYDYANSCYELGKYDDAIKNFTELLSSTTIGKTYIYRLLGLAYEKKGIKEEAKNNFMKALEFVQDNKFYSYYHKARIYSLLNEKDNSIANLKLAFENGFKDFERLNNEHNFDNISKSEEFIKLVNKYKKKLLK